jgi:predicted DCC family thiol-disulfide oxidoreductase YuxK
MSVPHLTLFYDGLCPLCSREIQHYRKRLPPEHTTYLDITAPGFDASAHGLDAKRVHEVMHVKVDDRVYRGVDAFLALWDAIPSHRWLARLARLPGVYSLLRAAYFLFARIRPWLPRRSPPCEEGTCSNR